MAEDREILVVKKLSRCGYILHRRVYSVLHMRLGVRCVNTVDTRYY